MGTSENAVPIFLVEVLDAGAGYPLTISGYLFFVHLPSMTAVQVAPSDDTSNLNE